MSWISKFARTNLGISYEGQDNIMTAAAIIAAAYGGYAAFGGAGSAAGGAAAAAGGGAAAGGSAMSGWGTAAMGAGLSMYGQQMANDQSQSNAQDMMKFQSLMSSTSHQREVADLKAAGLNPILSVNAGASTPSGATSQAQNIVAPALDSAVSLKNADLAIQRQSQELSNMRASKSLTESQERKTNQETKILGKEAWKGELTDTIWNQVKKLTGAMSAKEKARNTKEFGEPEWKKEANDLYEKSKSWLQRPIKLHNNYK